MKKQIVVCAEGGCAGNFVATLIRTMEDPGHFAQHGHLISENGSCDFTSFAAWLHYDYLFERKKIKVYPENPTGFENVMSALLDPENTYEKCAPNGFQNRKFLLSVLHYWDPDNIKRMLSIPNLYVILVRCKEEDTDLAVYNKLFKNFEKGRAYNIKHLLWSHYDDLILNGRTDLANKLLSVNDMTAIPEDILDWLINQKRKYMEYRNKLPLPEPNSKLLTLYLDELYNNREDLINKISNFVELNKNDSTEDLYEEYMKSQKFVLNLLKEKNAKNN